MECPKCKSKDFIITESLSWKAYYDEEDNMIHAKNQNSYVDGVFCKKCNYDMTTEVEESGIFINFD